MDQTIDIRTIRVETLKMSQADFAAKIGVDQSTVSNWENNGVPKRGLLREALERRLASLLEQAA